MGGSELCTKHQMSLYGIWGKSVKFPPLSQVCITDGMNENEDSSLS